MASFTFSRFAMSFLPSNTAMAAMSSDSCTGSSRYFSPCFTFSMACLSPSTVGFTWAFVANAIMTAISIKIVFFIFIRVFSF